MNILRYDWSPEPSHLCLHNTRSWSCSSRIVTGDRTGAERSPLSVLASDSVETTRTGSKNKNLDQEHSSTNKNIDSFQNRSDGRHENRWGTAQINSDNNTATVVDSSCIISLKFATEKLNDSSRVSENRVSIVWEGSDFQTIIQFRLIRNP